MGVVRSKPLKSPEHLLEIICYVYDVVDGIADNGFARNHFWIGRAIVA